MSKTVIELENVSKYYRLGTISGKTINDDLQAFWAKLRGKENPLLEVGRTDHGNQDGEFIWALRNIYLKVEQGDILGIIGANGAGKSTLLKILSRITGPTSGKVKIKGRIGSLLEVGTGFHPELTGRENVYLNGAILGMRRFEIDKKFDEIVDFSGVEKYIDTPVKRYSSGMRVRLGFAVAAYLDPEILVVDEVLAVGDAEFQKKCLGKMSDVAGEGRTVLFVSHNMGSIGNLCTSSIVLKSGEIEYIGHTTDAISFYLSSDKEYLSIYQRRSGNQKAIIENVSFENEEIFSGDKLIIKFEINVFKMVNMFGMGFSIHDEQGKAMNISYYSDFHNVNLGKNIILAKINNLWFSAGRYTIRARLIEGKEDIDFPHGDIAEFYIMKNNFDPKFDGPGTDNTGLTILNIEWQNE